MEVHPSHKTRFSDSSLYDEICMLCGHTDSDREGRLKLPCPQARPEEKSSVPDVQSNKSNYWLRPSATFYEVISRLTGKPICQMPITDEPNLARAVIHCLDDESVAALCSALCQRQEYQQVAALVCLDLDVLQEVASNGGGCVDLVKQIAHTHKQKEEVTSKGSARRARFEAAQTLFHLQAAGLLVETPLDVIEPHVIEPHPEGEGI